MLNAKVAAKKRKDAKQKTIYGIENVTLDDLAAQFH